MIATENRAATAVDQAVMPGAEPFFFPATQNQSLKPAAA
jgi:hypothetical protein